jgi:hypothetical protein
VKAGKSKNKMKNLKKVIVEVVFIISIPISLLLGLVPGIGIMFLYHVVRGYIPCNWVIINGVEYLSTGSSWLDILVFAICVVVTTVFSLWCMYKIYGLDKMDPDPEE